MFTLRAQPDELEAMPGDFIVADLFEAVFNPLIRLDRRVFDALTEGLVVVDADLSVLRVNTASRGVLRWPARRSLWSTAPETLQ